MSEGFQVDVALFKSVREGTGETRAFIPAHGDIYVHPFSPTSIVY